jgi:hypothetical protein
LRANSITLHACQLFGNRPLSNSFVQRVTHYDASTRTRSIDATTASIARLCSRRNSGTIQNVPRDISDRTPGPRFRTPHHQAIPLKDRHAVRARLPGHTLRHFVRAARLRFCEVPHKTSLRTLSALGHNTTQPTLTKRNNATLTQRLDANSAVRIAEGS